MKTIILSSSLSPKSHSFILCQAVHKLLQSQNTDSELIDARNYKLAPYHDTQPNDMEKLSEHIHTADNIIIGMGVHCYSINDSLKMILDQCFTDMHGKFFGILCAAGGQRSYLATQHLIQICMNEWRMIALPRVVYATGQDFEDDKIINTDIHERLETFCDEFTTIGKKLLSQ